MMTLLQISGFDSSSCILIIYDFILVLLLHYLLLWIQGHLLKKTDISATKKCPFSFTANHGVKLINQNHYRSEKLPSLLIWDVYHHNQSGRQSNHGPSRISSSLLILIPAYLPICLFCIAAHLSITLINLSTCPCPAPLKSKL